jgi:predicted DNA-binding transcriptional regulator AlpA
MNSPTQAPAQTLTEREASPYIGLSRAWLRQSRMHGRGPAYIRIGRSVRYLVRDLDAFLEAHRVVTREVR